MTAAIRAWAAGVWEEAGAVSWATRSCRDAGALHLPRIGEEAVAYAMEWFMRSTAHRKNIFHEHYTHIGVGVARDDAGDTHFTLVFAGLLQSTGE